MLYCKTLVSICTLVHIHDGALVEEYIVSSTTFVVDNSIIQGFVLHLVHLANDYPV